MSLLKLKILALMDRYKQVTAVADALRMKQPTISFHMKKMEAEWGVKLFEGKSGRIYLTNAGKMLLPYAEEIGFLYAEAEEKIAELRDSERTILRLGCTDAAMTCLARSNGLSKLGQLNEIQMTFLKQDALSLYRSLQSKRLDLALCGEQPADSDDLRSAKLGVFPLRLVLPVNHPLSLKQTISFRDLAAYPFVLHSEPSVNEIVASWKEPMQAGATVTARMDSVEMLIQSVFSGLGLSVLPSCVLPDPANRVTSAEMPGHPEQWTLYAVWRADFWNARLMDRIVDSITF
ncbi:LysR family transcriptional regulator [Cohnella terricola]|uniref:LysR family transcriptional regulator n=1 Tax=Cohnella terricola TaxID=1289167 RepID=A0A559JDS8_9BACL|nr:LysR family transcriptional regulator [Cohnella terricola]TVX98029.1 LysR family transcriptional regulator [Cohnella terricola]